MKGVRGCEGVKALQWSQCLVREATQGHPHRLSPHTWMFLILNGNVCVNGCILKNLKRRALGIHFERLTSKMIYLNLEKGYILGELGKAFLHSTDRFVSRYLYQYE